MMIKKTAGKRTASEIKLVVGLGNPGSAYSHTYHNLGFLMIDRLATTLTLDTLQFKEIKKLDGDVIVSGKMIFFKPRTFMNESGGAVARALHHFHIAPEQILVVHDESDIPVGEFKLSFNRGAAGHRGIASIISALGTKGFWRFRIGIRPQKESTRLPAQKLVLRKITPTDEIILDAVLQEGVQVIEKLSTNEESP